MIEIALFGILVGTLASAVLLVLVIVAQTSVTYIAMTLITALRAEPGPRLLSPETERRARLLGLSAAVAGAGLAVAGLRVGSAGSGGELVPTLAVIITGAAALGSTTACAMLAGARGVIALQASRSARARALQAAASAAARRRAAEGRRRLQGDDLRDEEAAAEAALAKLRGALVELANARAAIADKLARCAPDSALATEYRRAEESMTMKLELGERVLGAALAAAFRLAVSVPLRRLLRRRPREALLGIERLEGAALEQAATALTSFLGEIREARRALDALGDKRPLGIKRDSDEDPWALARQDLDALENAYKSVLSRIEVVRVRRSAEATLSAVADAAGAVSSSGRGLPADQAEIEELAAEVARAETAVVMATPIESDAGAITVALSRCTAALDRSDGASLDELLKALRAIV